MEMTKETSKRKKQSKKIISRSDMIFYIITGIIITLFFIVVLYPILFVLAASFSSGDAVSAGKVFLWPVEFSHAHCLSEARLSCPEIEIFLRRWLYYSRNWPFLHYKIIENTRI